jgi:hypothetical protein
VEIEIGFIVPVLHEHLIDVHVVERQVRHNSNLLLLGGSDGSECRTLGSQQ